MTETQVIQEIFDTFKLNLSQKGFGAFGDDAVTLPAPSAQDQLILSTDSFCDGTHFDSSVEWESVGWKALVGSISDIVAMGAQPSFFMLNLILPKTFANHEGLLAGLYKAATKYNVSLLGGDVAKGESLALTLTVGGYQPQSQLKRNSGIKTKDVIFTNAPLGYPLLGFEQHKVGVKDGEFLKSFLYPETPVDLGLWLSQKNYVTSLRDVSDGLLSELRHLTGLVSNLSIKVFKPEFEDSFIRACGEQGLNPEEVFFKGGEDYTLLWSIQEHFKDKFIKDYLDFFKTPPLLVGEANELNDGLKVVYEPNQSLTDSIIPFEHFSS